MLHLYGGVKYNALWWYSWLHLAAQLDRWYATTQGAVGSRFTEILVEELWGVINRIWNSEITLVFACVILTKTLNFLQSRKIRSCISRCVGLWDKGFHAGLVVYA